MGTELSVACLGDLPCLVHPSQLPKDDTVKNNWSHITCVYDYLKYTCFMSDTKDVFDPSNALCRCSALYMRYRQWLEAMSGVSGIAPCNRSQFGTIIKLLMPHVKRRRARCGNDLRYYIYIGVQPKGLYKDGGPV